MEREEIIKQYHDWLMNNLPKDCNDLEDSDYNLLNNPKRMIEWFNGDVRTLVLRLAKRLSQVRALGPELTYKEERLVKETERYYAPLAGKLGLRRLETQLNEAVFKVQNPVVYDHLSKLLEQDKAQNQKAAEDFMKLCLRTVGNSFVHAVGWHVEYLTPYQYWKAMHETGANPTQISKHYICGTFDLLEAQDEVSWCHWDFSEQDLALLSYSALVASFQEVPGSFINNMNQYGDGTYRALHFKVKTPSDTIEEICIRSEAMVDESDYGCITELPDKWEMRQERIVNDLKNSLNI